MNIIEEKLVLKAPEGFEFLIEEIPVYFRGFPLGVCKIIKGEVITGEFSLKPDKKVLNEHYLSYGYLPDANIISAIMISDIPTPSATLIQRLRMITQSELNV